MANIKSAKKRILQSQKKTEFNKFRKTRIRSVIKSLNSLISNKKNLCGYMQNCVSYSSGENISRNIMKKRGRKKKSGARRG